MTRALIAKIHIAKTQLGLDDDTYRSLLHTATGKTSCANMANWEREIVLDAMRAKGFKSQKGSYNKTTKKLSPKSGSAKHPEIDKIRAIWITMGQHSIVKDASETALNSYVKRMSATLNKGAGVESVGWLNPAQAVAILEALKQWHRRILLARLQTVGVLLNKRLNYTAVIKAYTFEVKRGKL